ncbi:MAG: amylo-alpha-1,6-glucosidase [Planctomycetota bacterium]|nr:amylo-alpha-1,6-glucosidase [Planctomycetota bacterium]
MWNLPRGRKAFCELRAEWTIGSAAPKVLDMNGLDDTDTLTPPPPIVMAVKIAVARSLESEWLVTNGIGGYSFGTVAGPATRRYHGLLTAAFAPPLGRMLVLSSLKEVLLQSIEQTLLIPQTPVAEGAEAEASAAELESFCLENGLPVWQYHWGNNRLEKRVWMPQGQNTVQVRYRLLESEQPLCLRLEPMMDARALGEAPLATIEVGRLKQSGETTLDVDIAVGKSLRILFPQNAIWHPYATNQERPQFYSQEAACGYDGRGSVFSSGTFESWLRSDHPTVDVLASTESWSSIQATDPQTTLDTEQARRRQLLSQADKPHRNSVSNGASVRQQLVLAVDQFIITPLRREIPTEAPDAVVPQSSTEERTIIAGYPWFTDWGRDTMISLEGLTLVTGRAAEARMILQMFARHVQNGLIPNLFPEGGQQGLYNTADATLWFFHAVDRYVEWTNDRQTLHGLLPLLQEIIDWHLSGTSFGIHVDQSDGLLVQGASDYQLTWMDAKVGDWVVTPRRGKAVEINALWYNALRVLSAHWEQSGENARASEIAEHADRVYESFSRRFWNSSTGCLFDVIDGPDGDDESVRPNQLFSISLPNPVLAAEHWRPVLDTCTDQLLTPYGLRSLSPDDPQFKPVYQGDLPTRDAAYHQGTVWSWLIGPYLDAWLKTYPAEKQRGRAMLSGLTEHLTAAGIGSISEIFDATLPFAPRGCIAQAWSVAELLRCWCICTRPEKGSD